MAEVTTSSNSSTPNAYLPPRKKARLEGTDDPFKPVGSLTFLIDNFRAFSESQYGEEGNKRHCDAKISVRGLTFGLSVCSLHWTTSRRDPDQQAKEYNCMGVVLKCENASGCDVKGDGSWSSLASVTYLAKAAHKSRTIHIYESTHRFTSNDVELEVPLCFEYLLDERKGLYNKKKDTLELVVEISMDAPVGVMELAKPDHIQVDGETVFTNKHQLAMHSPYFHSLFYNAQFDEGQSGEYKLELEAPATVEHFKRMLQTMYPDNKPLDDECIEGVLHLANQFLVTVVEAKCLEFLMEESVKSALFKYRVADKYGYTALKKHVLRNLKVADFKDKMFKSNMVEYNQLGPSAAEAFMARYDDLFTPESDDNDNEDE